MSRRWQLVTLLFAALALLGSVVVLPLEPYAEPVMSALAETRATVEDRDLPQFALVSADGQTVPSTSLTGRPVYLAFWAEWCEICKSEMQSLDAFARAQQATVDVLLVTVDDDPAAAYQWLARRFPGGAGFRIMADPGGGVANRLFGTTGVPETFVLDPTGHLVARYVGPQEFTSPAHAQLVQQLGR